MESASAYILHSTRICSTLLIALYTANLTSAVLQEKALIGNNVKKVNVPVTVQCRRGGPVLQMGYEFLGHSTTVSAEAAEAALPSLMLWAQGERLVAKSCDPLVSVSGAINKFHTVWPSGQVR
jgi:hypothetical protein